MAAQQLFSDAAILQALRAAARQCGEPLSHTRYDGVAKDVSGPSAARIIQRFGSWRQACVAAGVKCAAPGRTYEQRWKQPQVVAAVAAFLSEPGCPGTYAAYVEWAKASHDRPSGPTVRNVAGGWKAATQAARR